jgi:hypothetical protein
LINDDLEHYGLVDNDDVLINTVVINLGDTEALEKVRVAAGAKACYPLNPNVYAVRLGALMWNGTHWDENTVIAPE